MVGEKSLQDILNVVASMAADGGIVAKPTKRTIGPLDEFGAFARLDPLLADLQKQYLDAKSTHGQSVREFGKDDAMTDMAQLMEDSAWCAVQTRYMEVRTDRAMMKEAQDLMRENLEEERAETQRAKEKEYLKVFMQLQMLERMHATDKKDSMTGWWLLFILLSQPQEQFRTFQPSYSFNRLAA